MIIFKLLAGARLFLASIGGVLLAVGGTTGFLSSCQNSPDMDTFGTFWIPDVTDVVVIAPICDGIVSFWDGSGAL